jgi:hypothetical protein
MTRRAREERSATRTRARSGRIGRSLWLNKGTEHKIRSVSRRTVRGFVDLGPINDLVSFDQQDGSAVGGWTQYGVIGAYAHTARHAVKCAEWCRTQHVAWRSSPRTGRAGFRLR